MLFLGLFKQNLAALHGVISQKKILFTSISFPA
jgi:hypothetical protein